MKFIARKHYQRCSIAEADVQLVNAGTTIATLTKAIGIPEPATMAMAGMGLIGLIAVRRRAA